MDALRNDGRQKTTGTSLSLRKTLVLELELIRSWSGCLGSDETESGEIHS